MVGFVLGFVAGVAWACWVLCLAYRWVVAKW
jgi:hypothetical protein